MPSPQAFYDDRITRYEGDLRSLQRRLNLVAVLRSIVFTILAVAMYYSFRERTVVWISLGTVSLVGFIVLVGIYFRLKDTKLLLEKLLFVNNNERKILHNGQNELPDGHSQLSSETYLDDLDIFGPRSLFHLLNRTTTSHGSEKLADLLKQPFLSPEEILRRQAAVQAIAPQAELRQLMTAKGLLSAEKEGNLHSLSDWLATPPRLYGRKSILLLRWVLVIYNLGGIFYYLSTDNIRPLLAGILVGWLFTGAFTRYISQQHPLIARKQAILNQYAAILALFNQLEDRGVSLLQEWQGRTKKAHKAIRQLSQLSAFFDQRMNMLVNLFLNSILLYDIW